MLWPLRTVLRFDAPFAGNNESMGSDATHFTAKIPAAHHQLSEARVELSSWLRSKLSGRTNTEAIVSDVTVVVTELAANVVDHTTSDWITLRIEVAPTAVVIEVVGGGPVDAIPIVEHWRDLEEGDRGRGLRIVRGICDDVEVSGDAEVTTVRVSVPLS